MGTVHIAVPFDQNWRLDVDGDEISPRRAFGATTAFDVETAGTATLSYSTPGSRTVALLFQLLLWAVALFAATRVSIPLARRRGPLVTDETLIMLGDDDFDVAAPLPALDPGLDMTGQIARVDVRTDEMREMDDVIGESFDDGLVDSTSTSMLPPIRSTSCRGSTI